MWRIIKKLIPTSVKNCIKFYIPYYVGILKHGKHYKKYSPNSVFLLGVPEHGNLGDQAITCAEMAMLDKFLPDRDLVCITEKDFFQNLACLAYFVKKHHNQCFFMGGGNMGEMYSFQESIRLIGIPKLMKAKIIIFPQTIDYETETKSLRNAQKVYGGHPNLTLFVRDEMSLFRAQRFFGNCRTYLVPDTVLSYRPELCSIERKNILFCVRQDKEKKDRTVLLLEEIEKYMLASGKQCIYTDTYNVSYSAPFNKQNTQLQKKWEEFVAAEVVVTDRLHGMIFALITGTPCIALDNSNGKVQSFYNTWLRGSKVFFVEEELEAGQIDRFMDDLAQNVTDLSIFNMENVYEPLRKEIQSYA